MQKLKWILMGCIMLLGWQCTTDFDIAADYKEVMLVYGVLNQQDPVHYIRIQRAFLDQQESALSFTGNPDSIYYGDILNVTVTEIQTNRIFPLQRVQADALGQPIVKDTGDFVQSPHFLYRFDNALNPNNTYRLRIENTVTGKIVTAETPLVQNFTVVRPFPEQVLNWLSPSQILTFWNLGGNARIHDLIVRFHWSIADPANPFVRIGRDSADWPVFRSVDYFEDTPRYSIDPDQFFVAIDNFVEPDPTVIRYFDSMTYIFPVGSQVMSDYINFNTVQSGITQDLAGALYTNMEGEDAFGLFAARFYKEVTGIFINGQTRDSLACGYRTNDLSFAPSNDPAKFPNYPYCN